MIDAISIVGFLQVWRKASSFKLHATSSLALLVACAGCNKSTPQAPVLRDGPIYQNDSAGMRFLVPERWQQTANSTLPDGPIEKEILLARYRIPTSAQGGTLEILCMSADQVTDPLAYHRQPSYGIEQWEIIEPPSTLTTQGQEAVHFLLQGKRKEASLGKEVFVFRRGERVFHYVGLFSAPDPNARQQIRRVVDSIVWKE